MALGLGFRIAQPHGTPVPLTTGNLMAHCEVLRVERSGSALVELRAAPSHEPLSSCGFEWPRGWRLHTVDWVPPGRLQRSPLFACTAGASDVLRVEVSRFGMEVCPLSFLRQTLDHATLAEVSDWGFAGMSIARAEAPSFSIRAVTSGPAVHILFASGHARSYVDRAAATLRTLSAYAPPAESSVAVTFGPLIGVRPAMWRHEREEKTPHGLSRDHLLRDTSEGHLSAYIRLQTLDRRVHPGTSPEVFLAQLDSTLSKAGLTLRAAERDVSPSGPTWVQRGVYLGNDLEVRRAFRQIGPCLVGIASAAPSFARAPLTYLHARRVFDWTLSALRGGA